MRIIFFSECGQAKYGAIHLKDALILISESYFVCMCVYLKMQYTKM